MLDAADKGFEVTVSVNDEANQYRQNVSVFKPQSKEDRAAKVAKVYYGSGQVFWSDGKVTLAPKKDAATAATSDVADDLPF